MLIQCLWPFSDVDLFYLRNISYFDNYEKRNSNVFEVNKVDYFFRKNTGSHLCEKLWRVKQLNI